MSRPPMMDKITAEAKEGVFVEIIQTICYVGACGVKASKMVHVLDKKGNHTYFVLCAEHLKEFEASGAEVREKRQQAAIYS